MQQPPFTPPPGTVHIDQYLLQLANRRENLQLQLNQINAQMAAIRAHYSQSRSNLIFKQSRHHKDHRLKALQPQKEQLQQQIMNIRAEIARVHGLKAQGILWIRMP